MDLAAMAPFPLACPRLPEQVQARLGRGQDPDIECNSISTIKAVVAASNALGIVAPESIEDEPETFVILPPGRNRIYARFGIVTRAGRTLSPAADAFVDHVVEVDEGNPAPAG